MGKGKQNQKVGKRFFAARFGSVNRYAGACVAIPTVWQAVRCGLRYMYVLLNQH